MRQSHDIVGAWQALRTRVTGANLADFPQSNGSWTEPVRLLHATGHDGVLAGGLGRQLLSWRFSETGFPGGLFCTRLPKGEDGGAGAGATVREPRPDAQGVFTRL